MNLRQTMPGVDERLGEDLKTARKAWMAMENSVSQDDVYEAWEEALWAAGELDLAAVIDAMGAGVACWCGHGRDKHDGEHCTGTDSFGWGESKQTRPCDCDTGYQISEDDEDIYDTVEAGKAAGLKFTVAWHLAYLNDETFYAASPAERYERMLAWVRRAQGKEPVPA